MFETRVRFSYRKCEFQEREFGSDFWFTSCERVAETCKMKRTKNPLSYGYDKMVHAPRNELEMDYVYIPLIPNQKQE